LLKKKIKSGRELNPFKIKSRAKLASLKYS